MTIETKECIGPDGKIYKRTVTECWQRAMGYFRPVSCFNEAKKSEFYGRKNFDIIKSNNSEFVKQYS